VQLLKLDLLKSFKLVIPDFCGTSKTLQVPSIRKTWLAYSRCKTTTRRKCQFVSALDFLAISMSNSFSFNHSNLLLRITEIIQWFELGSNSTHNDSVRLLGRFLSALDLAVSLRKRLIFGLTHHPTQKINSLHRFVRVEIKRTFFICEQVIRRSKFAIAERE
jgi:hypothetical protein